MLIARPLWCRLAQPLSAKPCDGFNNLFHARPQTGGSWVTKGLHSAVPEERRYEFPSADVGPYHCGGSYSSMRSSAVISRWRRPRKYCTTHSYSRSCASPSTASYRSTTCIDSNRAGRLSILASQVSLCQTRRRSVCGRPAARTSSALLTGPPPTRKQRTTRWRATRRER
jgi:hypothetical protein